tara:strand:- start:41 stop:331 length:291 start_codon:yes stop_codon:yes gene_type:complete
MEFKDLKFKKHSVVEGIQATLEVKPNIFISVVAGKGMYSTGKTGHREAVSKVEDVSTFEVGIIDENLEEENQEWDVQGWMSREEISKLIKSYGKST